MKKIIIVLIALILSFGNAIAKDDVSLDNLKYNSFFENAPNPKDILVFQKYLNGNMKFVYLGENSSVDIWLTINDEGMQVLSTTLDGKSIIVGAIYNSEGNNIVLETVEKIFPTIGTAIYMSSQQLVKSAINLESEFFAIKNKSLIQDQNKKENNKDVNKKIWSSLENTFYVEKGNPISPTVYVFTDIYCGHCSKLYSNLKYYVDRNIINVRYIPIGILGEPSIKAALSIFSSVDYSASWSDYYDNKNEMVLATPVNDKGLKKLQKNIEVFEKWNLKGTPSVFYKTKSGEVKFLYGQPKNIEEFINDISK